MCQLEIIFAPILGNRGNKKHMIIINMLQYLVTEGIVKLKQAITTTKKVYHLN
jgi:hypothetical protein